MPSIGKKQKLKKRMEFNEHILCKLVNIHNQ